MTSLTPMAQDTLRAATDRIIPADDYPSASQNGVMDYFDRQLSGDLADYRIFYQLGLNALGAEAVAMFGQPFAALPGSQQDQLLGLVEEGTVTTHWLVEPKRFFMRLVEHTAEGYYSDHEHNGGNPGETSWYMIGFLNRTGLPANEARSNV